MSLLNYSSITKNQLNEIKNEYTKSYTELIDRILLIENPTWDTLVQPFIDFDNSSTNITLLEMKDFYTTQEIREECNDISVELSKWGIEQSMRKDLYLKYKYYVDNNYESEKLTEEQKTYFDDLMLSYKMKGMDLPETVFDRIKEIKKEIGELCSNFNMNLGNEDYYELLDVKDLDGLPQKFLDDRKEDDKIKVTLKYPDIIPIMEYANDRELRKRFATLFKSRCMNVNTEITEKVFLLRKELASLFNFENYSDYKLQQSMAENTTNVMNFLNDLLVKVKPLLHNDYEQLEKLSGFKLEMYDIAYYSRKYVEQTCNFDKEQLKQYFPINKVISGTFEIYQKLLGFTFEKVLDMDHTFWHDSVELYKVSDTNNVCGYFYLDLFPREGKYGHAACFPFVTKSQVNLPVATMGCNFNKDNLSFDEVETFFHEFGHVMHHLSSESTIKDTASFSCEHDFVETPSQMFEEWCYHSETLKMMSDNLPDELVEKLNLSRKLLQGYHYARQLMFGIFDMKVHSKEFEGNSKELFSNIQKEILGLDTLEGTNEVASFGHLMGGYDAGYYGYAWSLVYAKDLFSKFKNNLLDPELGMKLRKQVLSQGSMRKSMISIKEFLEREPNNNEFINSLI
jgi:thimet oligopeptidase